MAVYEIEEEGEDEGQNLCGGCQWNVDGYHWLEEGKVGRSHRSQSGQHAKASPHYNMHSPAPRNINDAEVTHRVTGFHQPKHSRTPVEIRSQNLSSGSQLPEE